MTKLFRLLFIMILIGCSSDEPNTIYDENPIQQDPQDPNSENQDPVLADNVVSILDDKSQIISTESELANGIYIFEFSETPPEIEVDDIIVGTEGYGFIRRVANISANGNTITMTTSQASLNDVFISGTIEFTTVPKSSSKVTGKRISDYSARGINRLENEIIDFSDITISPFFDIIQGKITYDPEFYLKIDYYESNQGYLVWEYDDALLETSMNFKIQSPGIVSITDIPTTLDSYKDQYIQEVLPGFELKHTVSVEIIALFSLHTDDTFAMSAQSSNLTTVQFSVELDGEAWDPNDVQFNSNTSSEGVYLENIADVRQNLTIVARLSLNIQGAEAAYFNPQMSEDFVLNHAESIYWDSNLKVGLDLTYGVDIDIFGFDILDFADNKSFNNTLWNGPKNLSIQSGNDQTGVYCDANEPIPLEEPLEILVVDSHGKPLKDVNVYYEVTEGGGTVAAPYVETDISGIAKNYWTLGPDDENQTVEVSIFDHLGNLIGDSPLEFDATMIDLSGVWVLESTSSNCPEGLGYSLTMNCANNTLGFPGGGAEEITSATFAFNPDDLSLSMYISSVEYYEYHCDDLDVWYYTIDTGEFNLGGTYSDGEFTGTFSVCFTELPETPCMEGNYCCTGSFRMYKL